MNRRCFLDFAAVLGFGSTSMMLPFEDVMADELGLGFDMTKGTRSLDLYRTLKTKGTHSGERLTIDYMKNGVWQADAYSRICWILRDVVGKSWVAMDPSLIAILDWTQRYLRKYGYNSPIMITSGYRTIATNEGLPGSALDSQHLYGKAVDIYMPGLTPDFLGRLFRWLAQGGVGVYDSKKFVHVDTGRVRAWASK